jgi:hypothetical protein
MIFIHAITPFPSRIASIKIISMCYFSLVNKVHVNGAYAILAFGCIDNLWEKLTMHCYASIPVLLKTLVVYLQNFQSLD